MKYRNIFLNNFFILHKKPVQINYIICTGGGLLKVFYFLRNKIPPNARVNNARNITPRFERVGTMTAAGRTGPS